MTQGPNVDPPVVLVGKVLQEYVHTNFIVNSAFVLQLQS